MTEHNRKLVIIGNGFDLAHGLKTKGRDFREYLQNANEELLYFLESCARIDLWSDFERSLGHLDRKEIYTEELDGFDMIKNDEDEGRNHQVADRIRNIEDLIIDDTKRYLNSWILSIDTEVTPFQNIKKILNDAKVVSFNYTSTLETTYNLPSDNIIYLHGKAEIIQPRNQDDYFCPEPVPELVIGHGENVEPIDPGTYASSMSDEIVLDEVFSEGHRDILVELKKDTSKYMSRLNDVLCPMKEIYIIGHSLSEIDGPYFRAIARYVRPDTSIYVTYFGDDDLQRKRDVVQDYFFDGSCLFKKLEEL